MKKRSYTKIALALSIFLLLVWAALGAGATLAWFTDTTPVQKNTFIIGELNLDVYYKNDVVGDYTVVTSESALFNDQARYEPGYTQVVYLRIENNGNVDFDYMLSVDKYAYLDSINVYGTTLHLPDYLRFGVVFGANEADLERDTARAIADKDMNFLKLNQYSPKDTVTVSPGEVRYAALVVYMPEEIDNYANYMTGYAAPQVQLGVTIFAQQAGTL